MITADTIKAHIDALHLVEQFGIRTAPVPIDRIARSLGVKVQYGAFDDELSGMAFIKEGVPIIGVNSLHNLNRQRFTIAHELGHVRLHRDQLELAVHIDKGSLRRDALAHEGTDKTEIEANAFAAELLMPGPILEAMGVGADMDLEDDVQIASLAKKLKVSTMALQYRLQRL